MKSVLAGRKFNRRHSTYVPGCEALMRALKDEPCVKKIMLGEIRPAPGGRRAAKVRRVDGHFIEIQYRGPTAVQVLRVIADNATRVREIVTREHEAPQTGR